MPQEPDELPELERRREELYRELSQVGDFRPGSLNEVRRKCGKPNCACAAQAQQHHGIGQRLLDGRQIAILAHAASGRHHEAEQLLKTTTATEPWETW